MSGSSRSRYKPARFCGLDLRPQDPADLEGVVGVLAGVGRHGLDGGLVHRQDLLAFSDDVRDRDGREMEISQGEPVEVVLAPVRFQEIGQDHRVEIDAADVDALAFEDDEVVLDVLADLPDARILEGPAEDGEGFLEGNLVGGAQIVMPEREIERFARLEGEGHPDEPRPRREDIVGLGVDRDHAGLLDPAGQGFERGRVRDDAVIPGRGRGFLRVLGAQGGELELLEDPGGRLGVGLPGFEFLGIEGDVEVALDDDELPAHLELIQVRGDLLPQARVFQLVQVLEEVVERAVLLDQDSGRSSRRSPERREHCPKGLPRGRGGR